MLRSLSVAVIGAGNIAMTHLSAAAVTEGLTLSAVSDVQEDRAKAAAEKYGIRAYTDYRTMIEQEKPDIAVIALPHYLHKEAAVFCAEHGCHLMLEKPMALNVAECDAIIEAASRNNVKLMVGHTQHYISDNRRAKQIIESGELGKLVMINDARHVYYYRDNRPAWFYEKAKAGGGIMTNLGAHSIDKIQWLTNSEVISVKAKVHRPGMRGDVEGSGVAFLELASGVPATVAQSGYPGSHRDVTEIIFTEGMLKLSTRQGLWISRGGPYEKVDTGEDREPFELQFEDLISAIREDREPGCSGAYGRSIIAVLEALYGSSESGETMEVRQFRS